MNMVDRYVNADEYSHTKFNEKKSQKEMCLEYLKEYGSITPLEALSAFGSFRLSALIFELRKDGYDIATKLNEDGKHFAIYTLNREGDE